MFIFAAGAILPPLGIGLWTFNNWARISTIILGLALIYLSLLQVAGKYINAISQYVGTYKSHTDWIHIVLFLLVTTTTTNLIFHKEIKALLHDN